MTLREAVEKLAATGRSDRDAGATVLLGELRRLARSTLPRSVEGAGAIAEDVAVSMYLLCREGVPASVPGSDAALRGYLAVALKNRWVSLRRKEAALVPIDSAATDEERARVSRAIAQAEEEKQRALAADAEAARLGAELLERTVGLLKSLVSSALAAVRERHRSDQARAWNEMLRYYDGTELDEVIRAAGEVTDEQARNRRYTSFKRFRVTLLAAAKDLSPADERLVRAFVTEFLTFRRRMSDRLDLSVLKVEAERDPP